MATILAPVPRRRKMRPEEIDAKGRLLATTGNQNPVIQPVVIDGQAYLPQGRPAYGSGGGMRLGDEVVGVGRQTSGFGAGGGMGSGLMRGRLPASMESPQSAARWPVEYKRGLGAMVGGNVVAEDDFQQAWKERQAAIARGQTPPGPAQLMAGIAERATPMLTRTMGEVTIPQMVQDLQRQPVPVAPVMRPYAMSDRYGGSNVGMLNAAARSASSGSAGMGYSPVAASAGMIPSMAVGGAPKFFDVDAALGFRRAAEMNPSAAVSRTPTSPAAGTVRQPIDPLGGSSIGTNYGPGGQPPPVAPVAPNNVNYQQGHWFPGQQTQGPATAVVNSTTGGSVAPVAATPAAPVPPAGMSTRAKVLAGAGVVGAGGLLYGMANGQPIAPLLPAPEGTQNQYYSRMYSGVNGGLTADPRVAANRAAFEASMANRKNRAAGRGIAKGEARDLRMGQASPEVLARANFAQGDISLDRDWQGNIRMTRSMAPLIGMYGAQQRSVSDAAEPMLLAQAARYNTDMAAAQAELASATTPEAQAAAMQRMQEIQQRQFSVPQGQTPSQFMQGALGNEYSGAVSGQPQVVNTPIAPVRPVVNSSPTAGSEFQNGPPSVDPEPDINLPKDELIRKEKERQKQIADREAFERRKNTAKQGMIPWSKGDIAIATELDAHTAALKFQAMYGVSYEDALRRIQDKQRQASGLTIPIGY